MASSIELRHLTKRYGSTVAVSDLSLKVEPGEFFFILGPSGAGKTSTLEVICGLEQASGGEVLIDDQVINHLEPAQRDVAMAFESYALYPHMSVFDNLAFPLKAPGAGKRLDKKEIASRVEEVAEILQISELLKRRPGQLSGGQRQRVALGRAIVREPRVFLMDEAIVHLDAKLRAHMRGELKQLHQKLGTTIIYTTPDWLEAMSMATRIAVLRRGVLQQVGTPREVYNKPANQFVADLVGDPPMNFFSVELSSEGGVPRAINSMLRFDLDPATWSRLQEAKAPKRVTLGVRPADVHISLQQTPETPFAGQVLESEPIGRRTVIEVKVGKESVISKVFSAVPVRIGDPIWVGFPRATYHVFDPVEGRSYLAD